MDYHATCLLHDNPASKMRIGSPETRRNRVREKSNFASRFKLIWGVQPWPRKYFYLRKSEIVYLFLRPAPHEGRFAIVTDVGGRMRWTRAASTDE